MASRRRALLFLLAACSSDAPLSSFNLTVGEETDAFTRAPSPTELVVLRTSDSSEAARTKLPATELTLGDIGSSETIDLRLEARDAAGKALLVGYAGPVSGGELAGRTLSVLISRVGEFARLPGEVATRKNPLLAVVKNRFLVAADPSSDTSDLYDLLSLAPLPNPPKLPRVPKTMIAVGSRLLLVSDDGATFFDLADSSSNAASLPFDPVEIAGGTSAVSPKGVTMVVGSAARASKKVLRIAHDGAITALDLAFPRSRPAIVFAKGTGFVVVGGQADTAAEIEIIPEEGTASFPLGFTAPLGSEVAAAIDSSGALIVADAAHVRRYDLACRASCVAPLWKAALGAPHPVSIFPRAGEERALYVATRDDGSTIAETLEGDAVSEIPFRTARFGARTLTFSERTYFLGGANKIETMALPSQN